MEVKKKHGLKEGVGGTPDQIVDGFSNNLIMLHMIFTLHSEAMSPSSPVALPVLGTRDRATLMLNAKS